MHLETKRKIVHSGFGLLFALLIWCLPYWYGFVFILLCEALTIYLAELISAGKTMPILNRVITHTERGNKPVAEGVIWYFAGVLSTLVFFGLMLGLRKEYIVASMLVIALGDAAATALGRKIGRAKLPKTETKTYWGTGLGITAAFIGSYFVLSAIPQPLNHTLAMAFAGSVAGMLAEAYVRRVNDNITIPIAACTAIVLTKTILLIV